MVDTIQIIRNTFANMFKSGIFVPDKSGQKIVEILGAQFIADEESIFGIPNKSYIDREIEWYMTRSLSIYDMRLPVPKMWESVASKDGFINSNYGYLAFDPGNCCQVDNCIAELVEHPYSRRAVAIYTRPTMWVEYCKYGMSDFICTNTVQYFIRQNPGETDTLRFFARVDMRSNDVWAGYRNDYAWQRFIFDYVFAALQKTYPHLRRGAIIWGCGSLHMYERNFDLLRHYIDTGDPCPDPKDLVETRKKLVQERVIRE